MKKYTAEQVLEALIDSDSDRSCFDHFESDRDEVVSEADVFTDTETSSCVVDFSITRRSGRRRSAPDCLYVDTDSSDGDTSDTSWRDSRPSHSPYQSARVNRGRTQQRGRGQTREAHQYGPAGDQTRAAVNHPAEHPEPLHE
ncbi:hypothetical protein QQF64_009589 [Cirrhinus molitorella]|uniref:Uncharacterized protein n=1 Tax=Cirrhinus molitorella TaxID=172907 RepID=A0ABR3M1J8_9TELE